MYKFTADIFKKIDKNIEKPVKWIFENKKNKNDLEIYVDKYRFIYASESKLDNYMIAVDDKTNKDQAFVYYLSDDDKIGIDNPAGAFADCKKLREIDLSVFKFSNNYDFSGMFSNCTGLEKIIFPGTKLKLTKANRLFDSCLSLKEVDLSHFDFSDVKDMSEMFNNCTSLEKIIFPEMELGANNFEKMFDSCLSLKEVDFSNVKCTELKDINVKRMFNGCESLETVKFPDLSGCDIINAELMFCACSSLKKIEIAKISNFNCKNIQSIFDGINDSCEIKI